MIKLLFCSFFLAGVGGHPLCQDSTGIEGRVVLVGGNQMPSPGHPANPPGIGVKSTLYLFELTGIDQVVRSGDSSYYHAVKTRMVRQTDTDDKGYFKVLLPPGRYSLFTKKGDLFYASRRDDKNHIAPVEVLPGKMTRLVCRVESDHKPVY